MQAGPAAPGPLLRDRDRDRRPPPPSSGVGGALTAPSPGGKLVCNSEA